jgi:tetratricopeptide (TPR) repeat protein
MDGKLIHEFVDVLVWPVILVAAFFLFKREVKGLFERLSKLSFGDVSLELTDKVKALESFRRGTDSQRKADDQAEAMVDVQLSETLKPPFDEKELIAAIKGTSETSLNTNFRHTKDVRRKAWQSMQDKRRKKYASESEREQDIELSRLWMQRTIPILRALTETEHRGDWHRYYAQLGYALKDTGEIREARTVLDRAIELWKQHTGKPVSPHYLFNWVYCEVRIDNEEHADGQASDPVTQAAVKEGLEEGSAFPALAKAIKADPEIQSWLERNGHDWDWLELP